MSKLVIKTELGKTGERGILGYSWELSDGEEGSNLIVKSNRSFENRNCAYNDFFRARQLFKEDYSLKDIADLPILDDAVERLRNVADWTGDEQMTRVVLAVRELQANKAQKIASDLEFFLLNFVTTNMVHPSECLLEVTGLNEEELRFRVSHPSGCQNTLILSGKKEDIPNAEPETILGE